VLKIYIFFGIFALVLIGIVVSVVTTRRRGLRQKTNAVAAKPAAKVNAVAAKPAAKVAPSGSPDTMPPAAAFDPTATRIHFRPSGPAHALLERDETVLPTAVSARLVCVGGTQKGHSFPVTVAGITVGRDAENDIVISDLRVSHHHAWVGIVDHKAVLRDLGSTNGTFLNAQMDSLVSEVVLSPGDTIFFGGHGGQQFRFVVD